MAAQRPSSPVTIMDYTPEQLEAMQREIRLEYRNMLEDVKQNSGDASEPESSSLKECLEKSNQLFRKVTRTREATLDSQFLHLCASLGRQQAQKLNTDAREYHYEEYAEKLLTFLGARGDPNTGVTEEQWIKLGKACTSFFKTVPSFSYMLGSFDRGHVELRERKMRQREGKSDDKSKAVKPKELDTMKKSYQESTTEEVERILAILLKLCEECSTCLTVVKFYLLVISKFPKCKQMGLKKTSFLAPIPEKPIDYFEFVTDPDSFAHTVENMFHVSFLIKDNAAAIFLDDDGLPVIEPIIQSAEEGATASTGEKKMNQVIMEYDMDQWREIVDAFKITRPLIPPRRK